MEAAAKNPWMPYTGQREKRFYDVRLHDGTEHHGCWPNADRFHVCGDGSNRVLRDRQVAALRELPENWVPTRSSSVQFLDQQGAGPSAAYPSLQ